MSASAQVYIHYELLNSEMCKLYYIGIATIALSGLFELHMRGTYLNHEAKYILWVYNSNEPQ